MTNKPNILLKGERLILMASYCCEEDNPYCTDDCPCLDCIKMSNVVILDEDCAANVIGGYDYLKDKQLTEPKDDK